MENATMQMRKYFIALAMLCPLPAMAQDAAPTTPAVPATPAAPATSEEPPLSRAQFIQQMDAEFARLDADGSGFVTPEEIVAAQRSAARTEALRQNQAVFARLDTDRNGTLSPQEFAALANPGAVPVDATPLMQQFDGDRDGTITLIEYRVTTQANFDRVDGDRDGMITPLEMRAAGISGR